MTNLEEIAESDEHARWLVSEHGRMVLFGVRPRCTICEEWWPCDRASLAARAVLHAEEIGRLRGDYVELQRRAIAVTRIWDMLARCSDEFEPDDMAACGEYRDNLDEAIIGLMKMVDRPMWERREQEMRDASRPVS